MTITLSPRLMALVEAMTLLGDRAPATARDILVRAAAYGDVTDRQHAYVVDLIGKAGAAGPRSRPTIDLSRVNRMFDTASATLKRPFVIFATYKPHPDPILAAQGKQVVDVEFRVSQAPATGKNPGSLYVKRAGEYQGKIARDGTFSAARDAHPGMVEALTAFAEDPARAALAYGQASGSCCFCARELTDPRSVTAGYGPICADRFGLPWGVVCEEVA
jgi:Family of unknown function (DUF6011)